MEIDWKAKAIRFWLFGDEVSAEISSLGTWAAWHNTAITYVLPLGRGSAGDMVAAPDPEIPAVGRVKGEFDARPQPLANTTCDMKYRRVHG